MRVYIPSTLTDLAATLRAGVVTPRPALGFAVTPALREWYVEGDLEELEYVAMSEAARASLRLLDADESAPRRRVVLAAEVAESTARPDPDADRAAVRLTEPVPVAKVASVHVDDVAAEPTIRAAAEAVIAADLGSDDAQFAVDAAEGHELQWYATQEADDLVAGLA